MIALNVRLVEVPASLQAILASILQEIREMATSADRIRADIGKIQSDIASIQGQLQAASNADGISATDAAGLADQLDSVVSSLDSVAQAAAPAQPGETPVPSTNG